MRRVEAERDALVARLEAHDEIVSQQVGLFVDLQVNNRAIDHLLMEPAARLQQPLPPLRRTAFSRRDRF